MRRTIIAGVLRAPGFQVVVPRSSDQTDVGDVGSRSDAAVEAGGGAELHATGVGETGQTDNETDCLSVSLLHQASVTEASLNRTHLVGGTESVSLVAAATRFARVTRSWVIAFALRGADPHGCLSQ